MTLPKMGLKSGDTDHNRSNNRLGSVEDGVSTQILVCPVEC